MKKYRVIDGLGDCRCGKAASALLQNPVNPVNPVKKEAPWEEGLQLVYSCIKVSSKKTLLYKMDNCLSLVLLMISAAIIPLSGLAAASTNVAERIPVAKWDFDGSDGLVMKKCSICNDPERGKCLKLVSTASRATAKTAAMPDVAFPKTPYTLAIWLKPDKSVISDADVEMAKLGGRRMTKFASAMHDGKWHHLAVTYDPARTNAEYAAYVDWPDEKSPWRFMSFYEKDTGISKCILPFSFGDGQAVFGGKVGMSLFSVGYSGMIDDVTVYNRALTDDEVCGMAVVESE